MGGQVFFHNTVNTFTQDPQHLPKITDDGAELRSKQLLSTCHVLTTWFCVHMGQTGLGFIQTLGSASLKPTKYPNET